MEKYPKNRNRYFIHDHELKEMESNDKQKPIEQYSNNNSQINYNLKRLDIAKELLVAQIIAKTNNCMDDMVSNAITLADLLLERIKQ